MICGDKDGIHVYVWLIDFAVQQKLTQYCEATAAAAAGDAKLLQSCLTLCDPRDRSPPGSPVPGILQARTHETKKQTERKKQTKEWRIQSSLYGFYH